MALSLDTIITVAHLVRGAVDLYNRIDDWPDQMKKLGRRMKNLNVYLTELEEIVAKKANNAFVRLFSTQKKHLGLLLQDIRKDTESIKTLFHKWENDIGPLGFQFRFKTITQAYFALGSSSDKIAALIEDVNEHLQGIRDYLTLMGFKAAVLIGERQNANVAPAPMLGRQGKAQASEKKDDKNRRKPSPSPSPAPPRKNFKIIFVDPGNVARSVVAEALAKLMREWTKVSNGDWRIQTIHSAGVLVKDRSDVPEIESLKREVAGGQSPGRLALEAVFDNKNFDFPAKKDIHISMLRKRSNGIKKDLFKVYDFVLVFSSRDHESMLKVKSALIEKEGAKEMTEKGKGRILHLGSYLTLDGIPREIDDPSKVSKAPVTRADWNWKAAQIKLAIKEFLKQEMQWKQPPQRASEKQLDTVVLLKQDAKWNNQPPKIEEKVVEKNEVQKKGDQRKDVVQNGAVGKPNGKKDQKTGEHNKRDANNQVEKKPADKSLNNKKPAEKKPTEKKPEDKKAVVQKKLDEKKPWQKEAKMEAK
jgi:protein-tyrosine-phosphatase